MKLLLLLSLLLLACSSPTKPIKKQGMAIPISDTLQVKDAPIVQGE